MPRKRTTPNVAPPSTNVAPAPAAAAPPAPPVPPKPKRELTPYNAFVKQHYHSKEFEGKTSQQRMSALGQMWKTHKGAAGAGSKTVKP